MDIITERLTSCLTGLDFAEQVNLLLIKHKQIILIQTSQTGGQPFSETSPYEWLDLFISIKITSKVYIAQPENTRWRGKYGWSPVWLAQIQ